MIRRITLTLLLAATMAATASAQQGPVQVRYTEAISHQLRGSVVLNGTVESRESSVIASEIAGIVDKLHTREGEFVRKGNPIVSLKSEDLLLRRRAARGELTEANARLDLARTSLGRARGLFDDQVVSRQQLDDAVSEEQAWSGRLVSLEAEVARIERDLSRAVIRAPFSGVVTSERVAVGEWVATGGPIAELIDTTSLEVTVDAPERHYGAIRKGSTARVILPAMDNLEVIGSVRAIIPQSNTSSRTFPIKVSIPSDGAIGVGMRADVHLAVGSTRAVVMVPKDAIVRQGSRESVYLIGADQTVSPVPVTTGDSSGSWVEVRGEISSGDQVITRGNERLRPGQSVAGGSQEYKRP